MDLHHPNPAANDVDGGAVDLGDACGPVNVDAVQQVIAAKWAVDVINNQSLPHELVDLQVRAQPLPEQPQRQGGQPRHAGEGSYFYWRLTGFKLLDMF